MKEKNNGGFSLVEVLVAIVLLAALVIPTCSGLVLSLRMNERTQDLMQSQLAVSSAVETMMETGISSELYNEYSYRGRIPGMEEYGEWISEYPGAKEVAEYPKVLLILTPDMVGAEKYYDVIVISKDGLVEVKTSIRAT